VRPDVAACPGAVHPARLAPNAGMVRRALVKAPGRSGPVARVAGTRTARLALGQARAIA